MTETTQIESAGLEDDSFRRGLLFNTYLWMAWDDNEGVPEADDPDISPYVFGYIAGCPDTLRESVRELVDHRIELGDDEDAYCRWMNGLVHGVRAYIECKAGGA